METQYKTAGGKAAEAVSPEVAEQLGIFRRQEASARRKARRHNEASLDEIYEQTGWEPTDTTVDIEENYEEREEKETLIAAISKLSDKQRRLVRLYYYEKKTETEIARLFGVNQSNVHRQLETVHKALKKYFDP